MAKMCSQCGWTMNEYEMSCPRCGLPVPGAGTPMPASPGRKTTRSRVSTILIIALCVVLLVNGVIAGIWFPGFFTVQGGQGGSADDLSVKEGSAAYVSELAARIGTTSDISVSYSEEEMNQAPSYEAKVSPQTPSADCGEVHIDFSYNLEGEDTFIVKKLPEKTDENSGLTVKAYDFSLASGQREFATDVVITVPRTEDDNDTTYWATFNEETQKWERIYSTLSEDGKNYLVYTNHFCKDAKISVAKELYDKMFGAIKGKKEEARNAVKDLRGLFYYGEEINDATKEAYVFMFDPQSFEQYMDESCVSTLDELDQIIQKTPKDRYAYVSPMKSLFGYNEEPKFGIAEADVTTAIGGFVEAGADQLVNVGQLGGIAGKTAAAAGKAGGFVAKGSSVIGPVAFLWSGLTLSGKLTEEVSQGKTTLQAFGNHKIDTLSFVVSGIGVVATAASIPYLAAGCAIAGVGLYAASLINDSKRDLSVNELIYREYYTPEYGSARKFYYISVPSGVDTKNKKIGIIKKIEGLNAEQDAELQRMINRCGGLTGYNPFGIAADTEAYKDNPINMEWALALSTLYHANEKQPDKIVETVKKFYRNYASVCFDNGWDTYNELEKAYRTRKGYSSDFVMKTKESDKENFIENYMNELMKVHAPLIKDINEMYAHKAKAGMAEMVSADLAKLMNTQIAFYVYDEAVGMNDFSRSVYAVDYKTLPGYSEGKKPDAYETPMRFDSVKGPIILPGINQGGVYHTSTTEDYLAHSENFIPRYQPGKKNLVFKCTFYHYLLMGLPDFMIFHNVKDPDAKDLLVPIELSEPDQQGTINVVLNIKGQSKTGTVSEKLKIESSPMDWEYAEGTTATVVIDDKLNVEVSIPRGSTTESSGKYVTRSKCSAIRIKAKAQKHAREYFDVDGSWECYADVKDLKLNQTYDSFKEDKLDYSVRHDITVNGRVTVKCEKNGSRTEVIVVLPSYTDQRTETEYYSFEYVGNKTEVNKSTNKGYSMTWTLNNE